MRALFAVSIVLVLLSLVFTGERTAYSPLRNTVEAARRSSAVISSVLPGMNCGATFVAPDRVLTAYHCVRQTPVVVVKTLSIRTVPARLEKATPLVDLAVLKLTAPDPGARVPRVNEDVAAGDRVIAVGAPLDEYFFVTFGYVSTVSVWAFENCNPNDLVGTTPHQRLMLDIRYWFGNSGGGVFNEVGDLVGVFVRGRFTGLRDCEVERPNVGTPLWGFAVGPREIKRFLKEVIR